MDEKTKQQQKPEPKKPEPKKPYSPPTLTIHGTVEELTKKVGLHGQSDHGVPPHSRTQV